MESKLPAHNIKLIFRYYKITEIILMINELLLLLLGTPQLMQLYLQDNLIEDIEDGAFQNQTKLVELKLGNNRLTKIPQIRHSPNLRRLGLNNNRIQRIEDNALNRINLEELHVSNMYFKLQRGPSSRLSAWTIQLRKNVASVVSRWGHCVQFDRPGNRTPDLQHR